MSNWGIRVAGILLVASILWYGPWMLVNMNSDALWLAIPFVVATLLTMANVLVAFVNNWSRTAPTERPVPPGAEPLVAVLLPTCGEPVAMVDRTARSVLEQDWPQDRLRLIISDDGHAQGIADLAIRLRRAYPAATVLYHEPPLRGRPERQGEAKAGNLNSALALVDRLFPEVAFVETRDADDVVGDRGFLRQCIGQLAHYDRLAFVQTVKEAWVSEGDPFGNIEPLFYRGSMLARNAANAVFPCGSGLVWRRAALADIGGFPTWNLVEDLQSGVEALRRGWRGLYLPIVGAVGQHAPEDIPNVYKQRGTWALDTMRLLLWGDLRGLNLRQRLQFLELGLFYLQGVGIIIFLLSLAVTLAFHVYPLRLYQYSFAIRFWPFALMVEVFLAALNGRQPYESLWRLRQMWLGLAPVYAKACLLALFGDPGRKPSYRVTRKEHRFGWYWRETLAQTALLVLLSLSLVFGLATTPLLTEFDRGLAYWVLFYSTILGGFVGKSWFGTDWRRLAAGTPAARWALAGQRALRARRGATRAVPTQYRPRADG